MQGVTQIEDAFVKQTTASNVILLLPIMFWLYIFSLVFWLISCVTKQAEIDSNHTEMIEQQISVPTVNVNIIKERKLN